MHYQRRHGPHAGIIFLTLVTVLFSLPYFHYLANMSRSLKTIAEKLNNPNIKDSNPQEKLC